MSVLMVRAVDVQVVRHDEWTKIEASLQKKLQLYRDASGGGFWM